MSNIDILKDKIERINYIIHRYEEADKRVEFLKTELAKIKDAKKCINFKYSTTYMETTDIDIESYDSTNYLILIHQMVEHELKFAESTLEQEKKYLEKITIDTEGSICNE